MSTRAQLSITFGCLFGTLILALALFSYFVRKNDLYRRLDTGLQVASGATAMSAEHELNEHANRASGERDLQDVLNETRSAALNDTEILVCDGQRTAAYKPGRQNVDFCRTSRSLANTSTTTGMRVAALDLYSAKFRSTYAVYAAKPIEPLLAHLERIRIALFVLLPLGLIAAGIAGYYLASRTLRPLQQLAHTVDRVTSSDMSARVHVKSGGEIALLVRRFNSLLDRLEQAFKVQRTFMADASHQIRTPVTAALVAAQVARRALSATLEDYRESLAVVENQMSLLRRTIEDMFFLSQADTASLEIQRQEVFLEDAVSDAVHSARPLAAAKQQTLKVEALPEARCSGDQDLLRQVVLILLDNAIKYTPVGGCIGVSLGRRDDDWVCSVTDNGPGISPSAESRIFERFFREERPGTESLPGSGLGLAIGKSIMEAHSGSVTLVSSQPGCTTFALAIPADEVIQRNARAQANSLAVRM
ncbi:MAG TPA: ATP-binding protein [Bryobacteraceae bacterium]|jgi:heavy metal sensor kinase|nr:ATP-binding protein [Bryobacteraceae bacterium]